ncbi:hypothetical protein M1466_01400 [Candidatus Dependentiae bacterium]|nr:hypothetical protein [Candidatus Dependentiae bacterium]
MASTAVDTLITLARFDEDTAAFHKELAEQQKHQETITQAIAAAQQEKTTIHHHVVELQRMLKSHEHELNQLVQQQQLKEQQLTEQKHVQQFRALQAEIAQLTQRIETVEQQVLHLMQQYDDAVLHEPKKQQTAQERINALQHDLQVTQEQRATVTQRMQQRETERQQLTALLESSIVQEYERVRTALPKAVVTLHHGICGGCSMQLTIAAQEALRLKRMIRCDHCHRFIVKPS